GLVLLTTQAAGAQQGGSANGPGAVRWFGLLTENAAAARTFYADLFGWQMERTSSGGYVAVHDGQPFAGITQIGRSVPEIDESTWLVGVVVSDLPESVATARRLGAQVLRDVSRAEGFAQWAVIEDPQGAQVLLMVPERPLGGVRAPGNWVWAELWTTDQEASSRFYSQVIGWETVELDRPDGAYPTFQSAGEDRAGLVPIKRGEIENEWAAYLGVADLEATLVLARELGGKVLLEPNEEIHGGRVAVLADPTGVAFLVIELEGETP
ncbi:MAG: VOC family protein, partial [Acidobacteria bacterium]|nr:VOC family protein [Acidobacteriota bacterium]